MHLSLPTKFSEHTFAWLVDAWTATLQFRVHASNQFETGVQYVSKYVQPNLQLRRLWTPPEHAGVWFFQCAKLGRGMVFCIACLTIATVRPNQVLLVNFQMYNYLDMKVELLAGEQDSVVPPSMVRQHYFTMHDKGVDVAYHQIACGHMGFTYHPKQHLTSFILSAFAETFSQCT